MLTVLLKSIFAVLHFAVLRLLCCVLLCCVLPCCILLCCVLLCCILLCCILLCFICCLAFCCVAFCGVGLHFVVLHFVVLHFVAFCCASHNFSGPLSEHGCSGNIAFCCASWTTASNPKCVLQYTHHGRDSYRIKLISTAGQVSHIICFSKNLETRSKYIQQAMIIYPKSRSPKAL